MYFKKSVVNKTEAKRASLFRFPDSFAIAESSSFEPDVAIEHEDFDEDGDGQGIGKVLEPADFRKNHHGGICLFDPSGFKYSKNKNYPNGEIHWVCVYRRKQTGWCRSTCVTKDFNIVRRLVEHNHIPGVPSVITPHGNKKRKLPPLKYGVQHPENASGARRK